MTQKIKILITDDHNLIIEGIKYSLQNEKNIDVIATANSAKETMQRLADNEIDIILLDINLPDESGLKLCLKIKQKYKHIQIIGLSNNSQLSFIKEMIQNGASGYLLKNVSNSELISAIEKVYSGKKYFSDDIQDLLIQKSDYTPISVTQREREILVLISEGITSNQIADKLFISPLTADTHRKNLLLKFEASNTAQLIKKASVLGYL